ncbi:hypothetical protein PT974_03680 [Cladobotryum mycophilum]|uniref:C2H2-type domain-containing protein n=1 Tax=Cladobotryum mycophilum TaxID=491253 RepID=A0ABR0SU77_9HYPO
MSREPRHSQSSFAANQEPQSSLSYPKQLFASDVASDPENMLMTSGLGITDSQWPTGHSIDEFPHEMDWEASPLTLQSSYSDIRAPVRLFNHTGINLHGSGPDYQIAATSESQWGVQSKGSYRSTVVEQQQQQVATQRLLSTTSVYFPELAESDGVCSRWLFQEANVGTPKLDIRLKVLVCPSAKGPIYSLDPFCCDVFRANSELERHIQERHFAPCAKSYPTLDFRNSRAHQILNGSIHNLAQTASQVSVLSEKQKAEIILQQPQGTIEAQWSHIYKNMPGGGAPIPSPYHEIDWVKSMGFFLQFLDDRGRQTLGPIYEKIPVESRTVFPSSEEMYQLAFRLWLPEAFKRYAHEGTNMFGLVLEQQNFAVGISLAAPAPPSTE